MKKALFVCLLVLCWRLPGSGQDQPKRPPSTPEERQRFLALTHKLEESPLDKSLYADKKWALKWIDDIPDINVTICPTILGEDFALSNYKYAADIQGQVVFGNVAFLIDHPDKANDHVAQFTAGVESALKAYKSILKADPVVSRSLEKLLQAQTQGKLTDFVRETSRTCQEGDRTGM
ncbi:MAG TPA: hypothetical protein VKW06_04125 [Candidatus Angelobacter sp.]|nr:hypothetical protein [Candidatus Angelobacter sp.]